MIIDHTENNLNRLEGLITKNDGTPLYGEIDMYRRIYKDCEKSNVIWHFWHDLRMQVFDGEAGAMQIDFLLISDLGMIIIEVKGGTLQIEAGKYFFQNKGILSPIEPSPFKQAENYKWAMINNGVINGDEVFVDYICAFPHAGLKHTSDIPALDLSYKMWNKQKQESDESFADFCKNVLYEDKYKSHWHKKNLSSDVLESIINNFAPTYKDPERYCQSSLKDILKWLNISNMDALESLQKNKRIIIEGGPGTGKTTIAKAFVKKNKGLHGIYLCWTKFLAAKMKYTLQLEGLLNCEVESYASYIHHISEGKVSIDELSLTTTSAYELENKLVPHLTDQSYDYVIIDEAQDVADKGMLGLLNELTSLQHTGLQTGRFLVLYDIEQGYNSGSRNLESMIGNLVTTSAHFTINGNKRVPTNIEIVKYANEVLSLPIDNMLSFWNKINNVNNGCEIHIFDETKVLTKAIKQKRKEIVSRGSSLHNSTILVHSDLMTPIQGELDSVFERLTFSDSFKEITVNNVCDNFEHTLGLTSILKYKGLENENIILVIPSKPYKSSFKNFSFEVYIGMTRAIMNLDIYILKI